MIEQRQCLYSIKFPKEHEHFLQAAREGTYALKDSDIVTQRV